MGWFRRAQSWACPPGRGLSSGCRGLAPPESRGPCGEQGEQYQVLQQEPTPDTVGWWAGSMGFEELLEQVGGFGPFQLRNLALLALPRILLPLHFLLPVFLAAVPAHRCALPGAPTNLSHQDAWLETYVPREPDGTFSSCLRFAHPQAPQNITLGREGPSPGELGGTPSTVPCSQGWEYDRSEFSSTITTEVHELRRGGMLCVCVCTCTFVYLCAFVYLCVFMFLCWHVCVSPCLCMSVFTCGYGCGQALHCLW